MFLSAVLNIVIGAAAHLTHSLRCAFENNNNVQGSSCAWLRVGPTVALKAPTVEARAFDTLSMSGKKRTCFALTKGPRPPPMGGTSISISGSSSSSSSSSGDAESSGAFLHEDFAWLDFSSTATELASSHAKLSLQSLASPLGDGARRVAPAVDPTAAQAKIRCSGEQQSR